MVIVPEPKGYEVSIGSENGFSHVELSGWLSGVAVACQRCRASDPVSLPGLALGR